MAKKRKNSATSSIIAITPSASQQALGCMFNKMVIKQEPIEPPDSQAPTTAAASDDKKEQAPTIAAASHDKKEQQPDSYVDRTFGGKARYNRFSYRLKQAGPELTQQYEELKDAKENTEKYERLKTFIETIVTSRGILPADAICRKRRKVDEVTKNSEEGWVAWSKAARDEGEDVLLELVESGAIKSRPRPDLLANSKIKYPNNLQVFIVNETIKKKEGAVDETELTETADPEEPAEHEEFLKSFTADKVQLKYKNDPNRAPAVPAGPASAAGLSSRASVTSSEAATATKPVLDDKNEDCAQEPAQAAFYVGSPRA